ncbi:MAG TPA: SIMPL domain-containing protein, partial [Anaerolineaceae bacterium]|nr:SIMPL domain-containing protein [Anaerolineaceae bacterium]
MNRLARFVLIGILVVLSLSACIPGVATAQGVGPNVRLLSVSGKGEVRVAPDIAYVYIGVRSQAENVAEALSENNSQAQAISQTLQELGVAPEDIQTTAFNVFPQQEIGPQGEVTRTVYVVENTVFVTVRDLQQLGNLLDQVVRSGANSINGVAFDVENRNEIASEARQLAVADARAKAEEMATAAGVELGNLYSLGVYANDIPTPVYEGKGGAAAPMGSPV